ncbi:MAG: STAS domain-containing protein [Herpetosiphonaceae bacterium]|nr:STAS domain-containing protein [Herpetosiphonaceae bacterium]
MHSIQTAAQIQFQRARTYALVVAGMSLFFGLIGIADGLVAGSWTIIVLALVLLVTALSYRAALRPATVHSFTLVLLSVQLVLVAGAVHNVGGFLSHAVAFYTLVLVGSSFILMRWRWIVAATGLTLLTAIALGILEQMLILTPNKPGAVLLQTSSTFQIFALVSQALVIIGVGALCLLMMQLIQRRERELETAREAMAQRSLELSTLASTLESTNIELQSTQTSLRDTVDALTVTALPVGAGTLVLPLIGAFDALRAKAVVERLLESVYRQRAHTVILDLTGISQASPALNQMLERSIGSVRMLGAQVVLAGLQPDLASMLVHQQFTFDAVTSAPTLAAALHVVNKG